MRGTQFAQLSAFVAVAEHRSFTKAATYLGISTPSLSQAIRRLEEQFGVRLLNRTTRSVALTEAGEQLLGHLNPVLEGVENAIDSGIRKRLVSEHRSRSGSYEHLCLWCKPGGV